MGGGTCLENRLRVIACGFDSRLFRIETQEPLDGGGLAWWSRVDRLRDHGERRATVILPTSDAP